MGLRAGTFWIIAVAGALGLPIALFIGDVILGPPSRMWHLLFWPVDVLLWTTGPGVRLSNGWFEWTPVQDFAVWLGIGCSWLFWLLALRFALRVASSVTWHRSSTARKV
jgi:hypothetical protein